MNDWPSLPYPNGWVEEKVEEKTHVAIAIGLLERSRLSPCQAFAGGVGPSGPYCTPDFLIFVLHHQHLVTNPPKGPSILRETLFLHTITRRLHPAEIVTLFFVHTASRQRNAGHTLGGATTMHMRTV